MEKHFLQPLFNPASIVVFAGGLDPDALVVTRAESVTWNDGALGCPEPGMFYTQALVDGYWIVVEAGDQSLDYRAQGNGYFRLCAGRAGRAPGGPATPVDNTK